MNQLNRLLADVPVDHGRFQTVPQLHIFHEFLHDHRRAVLAAGAAHTDHQIGPAFPDVVRHEKIQEVVQQREQFPRFLAGQNIGGNFFIEAVQRPERLDKKWIGKKPDIEQEINVLRDTELISKRDKGNVQFLG